MDSFTPQNGTQMVGLMVHGLRNRINSGQAKKTDEALAQIGQGIRNDSKISPVMEMLDNAEQEYLTALSDYNLQHPQRSVEAQRQNNSGGLLSLGLSFGPGSAAGGTAAAPKESVLENVAAKNTGTNIGSTSATVNKYNRTAWEKALNNANDWRR